MGVFFVGWELWQDMTFVLACCIALVFAFGLVRLWWTNRRIARLELIDEERRMRLAEMRYCGINAHGMADIPFGVRAIQRGVQVEGIWISRPNTPDASHGSSSPTLIGDSTDSRSKGKFIDRSYRDKGKSRHISVEIAETAMSSPPIGAASGYAAPLPTDELDLNESRQLPHHHQIDAHENQRRNIARNLASRSSSANRTSMASSTGEIVIPRSRSSYASTKPMLAVATDSFFDISRSGTKEVYAALPTATWDYGYSSYDADGSEMASQRSNPGPSKLQKKSRLRRQHEPL